MIVLTTRKYRRSMEAYRRNWGLEREKGFTVETGKPLGRPARRLLTRIQKNLHARKLLPEKFIDGTLNSKTQALLIPPLTPGDKIVSYALSQVGVHESPWGTNRGKDVHRYQSSTGAYNAAWCASFVCYCWQKAGYRGPVSAGAWDLTDHIGVRQTVHTTKAGDACSFNTGDGHVGIVLSVNWRTGKIKTCDGNTNDQVAVRERPISQIHSITRPVFP